MVKRMRDIMVLLARTTLNPSSASERNRRNYESSIDTANNERPWTSCLILARCCTKRSSYNKSHCIVHQ